MKSIIVSIAIMLLPVKAFSDTQYGFAKITCSKELDFFEVQAVKIFNIPYKMIDDLDRFTQYGDLSGKEGIVFYSKPISYECKLQSRTIGLIIKNREPTSTGQCGGEARGTIGVKQDNTHVVSGMFGSGCFNSLHTITSHPYNEVHRKSLWSICKKKPTRDSKYPDYSYSTICTDKWIK